MIKLEEFKNNLKDVLRPNRFFVEIFTPSFLKNELGDRISFFVKGSEIPSKIINEIEIKYFDQSIKIPGDLTFNDLTLTFYNDYDYNIRTLFERWQYEITTTDTSFRRNSLEILNESFLVLHQLGRKDEKIATYLFYHIYPKEISNIELNMDSIDAAEEFSVTFSYSFWERDDSKWANSSKGSINFIDILKEY